MHGTGRRQLLRLGGAALLSGCRPRTEPTPGAGLLEGKASDLIVLTDRPLNAETPLRYFRHDLTPNDAFFVRWHLSGMPGPVDLRTFRLRVGGHVERPLSLSVDELKAMEATVLVAVNQCSGNSRALSSPRVAGLQWSHGAMGNARWRGVPLRALLARAGVKAGASEVSFGALDTPPMATVPDFVKSLPVDHASDGEVMVAYAMNDAPLPALNGFPLRLIVPGHYSTYWVKALDEITVLPAAYDGFWMKKAYRIPTTPGAAESPDALAKDTTPIGRMNVRSLVVSPEPGATLPAGRPGEIEGIAFDGGTGIRRIEVSTDGGATWSDARLDPDLGRYSWRRWRMPWTPTAAGPTRLLVRATSTSGETQPTTPTWNRAGYMRNVVESVEVRIT